VTLPKQTGRLDPTWISDPTYFGDEYPGRVPGDGVVGPTGISVALGSERYSSAYELSTPGMKFLIEADSLYLTPGLLALTSLYAADALQSNNAFLSIVAYFIPFFMSAFVIVIVLYFLPETVRENKRMQTKRAMLLYLPVFVVSRIRSIRELIRDIVANEAGPLGTITRVDDRPGAADARR